MKPFNWTCPYCGRAQAVTDARHSVATGGIYNDASRYKALGYRLYSTVCSNPDCLEIKLLLHIGRRKDTMDENGFTGLPIWDWPLLPESSAKPQPDYIPEPIVDNYNQACRIRDLSANASAAMSRRCLQGIIRDFWKVKGKPNLWSEIEAIKDKIDPVTWNAIDAVRKVGKVGAHMEEDVNVIIDVEPEEAQLLVGLIETLFRDWYVTRREREKSMTELTALGAVKQQEMDDAKKVAKEAAKKAAAADPAPQAAGGKAQKKGK